jgi:hypothetical protein
MSYRITIEEISEKREAFVGESLEAREIYRRTVSELDVEAVIIAVDNLDNRQVVP